MTISTAESQIVLKCKGMDIVEGMDSFLTNIHTFKIENTACSQTSHLSHAPDAFSFLVAHSVTELVALKDDVQLFHFSLLCKTPAGFLHEAPDAA